MGTLITSIDIGLVELGISLAKVNMETCTIQKNIKSLKILIWLKLRIKRVDLWNVHTMQK